MSRRPSCYYDGAGKGLCSSWGQWGVIVCIMIIETGIDEYEYSLEWQDRQEPGSERSLQHVTNNKLWKHISSQLRISWCWLLKVCECILRTIGNMPCLLSQLLGGMCVDNALIHEVSDVFFFCIWVSIFIYLLKHIRRLVVVSIKIMILCDVQYFQIDPCQDTKDYLLNNIKLWTCPW